MNNGLSRRDFIHLSTLAVAGAGMAGCAHHAASLEEAAEALRGTLREGDALLVKGSRGLALERIRDLLRGGAPAACGGAAR